DDVDCAFYMKCGSCNFGSTCKFNHPELPHMAPHVGPPRFTSLHRADCHPEQRDLTDAWLLPAGPRMHPFSPHPFPERPGQPECAFYMKTGQCKFGAYCKPVQIRSRLQASANSEQAASSIIPACASPPPHLPLPFPSPPPHLPLPFPSSSPPPSPPHQFYMKTGQCKFGADCKFHHPRMRLPSPSAAAASGAGGTGQGAGGGGGIGGGGMGGEGGGTDGHVCRYRATCKFDHPPPAEAAARMF
ncbi:unnamed protein product, partial [Closterium sp. Naga37s-1]